MPIIYGLLYNAFLLGGTAYIVFWLGHSGWWFLFTFIFLMDVRYKSDND